MIKITALTAEAFTTISELANRLDSEEVLLSYFDEIEQLDKTELEVPPAEDSDDITIILKNRRKFKKDLNKRKYIIPLPTVFKMEGFEVVQIYQQQDIKRIGNYTILIRGKVDGYDNVHVIFILMGFNDSAIKIISSDDLSSLNVKTSAFPLPCPPINTLIPRVKYYQVSYKYPPICPPDPPRYVDRLAPPPPCGCGNPPKFEDFIYDFLF